MSGVCPFAALKRAETMAETDLHLTATTATCPAGFGRKATATCPVGFGGRAKTACPVSFSGLPRMPLAVMAEHQGSGVRLASVKGVIFDVSSDAAFGNDGRLAQMPGHDISRVIALCGMKEEDGGVADRDTNFDAGLEGLKYEDHQRLESYFVEMVQGRRAVAVLTEEDYARIFGAPLGGTRQGVTVVQANDHNTPDSPSKETKLHALVERGDADAVQEFFRNEQDTATGKAGEPPELQETTPPSKAMAAAAAAAAAVVEGSNIIVDTPCPRTGMTPLLKAVEGSSEAVVRVLLEAGADVRRQATLYDGDDAIALARRLGSRDVIVEMLLATSQQ